MKRIDYYILIYYNENEMTQKDKTETDKIIRKIKRLAGRSILKSATGKWNEAMELIEKGDELIKSFQENLPRELEDAHCDLLYSKSIILLKRGLLGHYFRWISEYSTVAQKYGNKKHIALSIYLFAVHYWYSNDLDKALEHIESAITLLEECYKNDDRFPIYWVNEVYYHAIKIVIERKELERARPYLKRLEEIRELNSNDSLLRILYQLSEACLLKASKRARDRVRAEELYKEVCKTEIRPDWFFSEALAGRIELLLIELKSTDEIEIIDEIKPLLEEFIDLAQQTQSEITLLVAYVLQGKLSLLTFEIRIARRFLIQAQRIAERRGYKSIANEITRLHKDLKDNLDEWENLKQQNAPLSKRIKLAKITEDLSSQFSKGIANMEQVSEKKVTVYSDLKTCVVCKGSAAGFNIYVCPQCSSIYCRGCAKAVIELENACWTCESPIDKTKPSQLLEREEEKTKIKTKSTKKNSQK